MLLVPMLLMAQNQESLETVEQHLTFKGIPIDGTLQEVVSKLERQRLSIPQESTTQPAAGSTAAEATLSHATCISSP